MDFNISKLSQTFYQNYPHNEYPEILAKESRPYCCVSIYDERGFYICIPYRSRINHRRNAFIFQARHTSSRIRPGLDYTKIVIVKNLEYIDTHVTIIDTDEYRKTVRYIERIRQEAISYINTYINHQKGIQALSAHDYAHQYGCSSLKYFHNELGI